MAKVTVVFESNIDGAWAVGYVGEEPAVRDMEGGWYFVREGDAVQVYGFVFHVEGGEWKEARADHWDGDVSTSDDITFGGPDFVEGED